MGPALLLVLLVLLVAYANGANDNMKGVATLYGSGAASFPRALAWGTATTLAGSLTAMYACSSLLLTFTGRETIPGAWAGTPQLIVPVAAGTAATVILATALSLPVSTTHALLGGLLGAGLVLTGGEVRFLLLGKLFLLPLLFSPIAALLLTSVALRVMAWASRRRTPCICIGENAAVLAGPEVAASGRGGVWMCEIPARGEVRLRSRSDFPHFLSAGAVSFARGLNDTPKIAALLLVSHAFGLSGGMLLIGLAMAAGALLHSRRVAQTMGKGITAMSSGQGCVANLVTSALVIAASRFGLPVSTTHVSCGALFGLGIVTRSGRRALMARIALAWAITVPLSAGVAALAAWMILPGSR